MALAVIALLVLALVVRLGFVAATADYAPGHDDLRYDRLACSIVLGGGYPLCGPASDAASCGRMPSGGNQPSAFRPPGYPAFLAGVYAGTGSGGQRWRAGRIANALLGTAAVGLIGLIGWQTWRRRAIVLVALALGAVHLPLVLAGGSLVSEPLFVVLVLGALAATLAAREQAAAKPRSRLLSWAALTGVLCGLAALTRPNVLILLAPLGVGLGAALTRHPDAPTRPARLRAALPAVAALLTATALTIAPWTWRNHDRMHHFIPISTHVGSWLSGTYNDVAVDHPVHPGAWRVPGKLAAFADIDGDPELDETERQQALTQRSLDYIADRPTAVPKVLWFNTLRMLNLQGASWWRQQAGSISLPRRAGDWSAWWFSVLALLALGGAFTRAARRAPAWLWALPLLLFASVIPAGSEVRYRAPVEPFVVLLAALLVVALADCVRDRARQRRGTSR